MEQPAPIVLCVEDDRDTVEMLRILLEDRGYGFRAAVSCAEAMRLISEGFASVVLLDNRLPDGSGIDVCRQVRQFDKDLPIIFFSGAQNERELALSAGANAFVGKPCALEDLLGVLARFLSPSS